MGYPSDSLAPSDRSRHPGWHAAARSGNVRIPVSPSPIHLAESVDRRPGSSYRWLGTGGAATASTPVQTDTPPDRALIQHPAAPQRRQTHASPLDGFRVGSVAQKRFWRVFRRANVGFQMSNAIPHARPQCLSAYRNELESMSEIPTLNSRAREDGVRAWPPDPVFAPPTRRTERSGDTPWCSRGPSRSEYQPVRRRPFYGPSIESRDGVAIPPFWTSIDFQIHR